MTISSESFTLTRRLVRNPPSRTLVALRKFVRRIGDSGEYAILRMMNYDEELVVPNDMKFADMPPDTAKQFEVHRGDILFNRTNSADLVGKVGIFDLEGTYLFASYLIRLRTDVSLMLPEY